MTPPAANGWRSQPRNEATHEPLGGAALAEEAWWALFRPLPSTRYRRGRLAPVRRDHSGALHTLILHLYPRDQCREGALALRHACHGLRDRLDEIDLAAMEVSG